MLSALSRAIQHIVSTEYSSKIQNNLAQMPYCLELSPVDIFMGSYRHGVNMRPTFYCIYGFSLTSHVAMARGNFHRKNCRIIGYTAVGKCNMSIYLFTAMSEWSV